MALKKKFFKMLGDLDEEETTLFRDFFKEDVSTESKPSENDGEDQTQEVAPSEAAEAQSEPEAVEEEVTETEKPGEPEAEAEPAAEPVPTEEAVEEAATEPAVEPEQAISFDKSAPAPNDEIIADDGQELGVDTQAIIEALTAKNMALEAENSKLKAKTEGAFGYSSKMPGMARVNPLYNDDVSDIKFRK